MTQYGVIIFPTTSAVMQAEKSILKKGIEIKLIPTPREFSADCGISIRFEWQDKAGIEGILTGKAIRYEAIQKMD